MSPPLESEAPALGADYLDRVRALAPLIERSIEAIERDRRLPPALIAAMKEADLFRMLLPSPFGGAEIDPPSFVQVVEAVARIDASTAWILCQTAVTAMVAARLEPSAAREMWSDPQTILAWGPSTDSRAVPVAGGFRVSGNFAFASGCWYATWLGGDCTVCDADGTVQRDGKGKPVTRRVLFPAARAEMRDIWHVIGLRGTGSDGYTVTDLFVPEQFSVARFDDPAALRYGGRLYAVSGYSMFACGFAALALGVACTMLDSYIALAKAKTPRGYKSALGNDGFTQGEIGQTEARLRAARAFVMGALADAWEEAQRTGAVGLEARMAIRLPGTFGIREAKAVADIAYDGAGTSAVFASGPFERRFRDIHTVAQQLQGRKSHYQTVGQYLLGLESEQGWV